MIPPQLQPLADHLWQSTLFAAVAGLLTLAFRSNRAQIRYCLWFAASVKFLIPFSVLVDMGSHFGRYSMPPAAPASVPFLVEYVSEAFVVPRSVAAVAMPSPSTLSVNAIIGCFAAVWAIGCVVLVSSWWLRWRRVSAILRSSSPVHWPINLKTMSSPAFREPGVFGILDPILLLPEGITARLTAPQLEAVLAHELCHVRRRDNLTAAIHMLVEAVFWFHPLVWFLGARLMDEREHACDEEVLRIGNEPQVYAEAVLKICEFYLESPLPCVAG
jgi:beta-lactamase regulating signal transducer with metallopeptidase domain